MSNLPEQYKLFGDDNGDLLPEEKLFPKVIDASTSLSSITDPDSTYKALENMSAEDVRLVVSLARERIGDINILRIHAAKPLWLQSELVVRSCAERVAESGDIPADIRVIVEGWAEEVMINIRMRATKILN